ncbi:MAG: efflux RND transporter periplasmic adaptor subunit [Deltaproteobacteria bacterium]|nr:efflux RND transporter periplasmic adaptor subunit [Deltaproteobacteria bacterium]
MQHISYGKALLIIFTVIMLSGWGANGNAEETAAKEAGGIQKVKTAPVELRDFQPIIQATGTLVPRRHTDVYSLAGGQIEKLPVDIGDTVSKGALLFMIRTVDYRLALQQSEANLARAAVMVRDRKREKERIKNLFEAGSATQQMHDQTITAHEETEAALAQAVAARDIARQALKDCTALAPYDAVITARYLEEGEFIGKGKRVLEIMDLSVLNAEMELPERYAGTVTKGLSVDLSFNYRDESVQGTIVAVNPKLNPANRTFLVKVAVDNREGALQAGLFCTGRFKLPVKEKQMAIPATALLRDEGRSTVWVIMDGKAYPKNVKEGDFFNGLVWILDGLEPGDRVVTKGSGGLIEGTSVTVSN